MKDRRAWTRILLGLAVGAVAGLILGRWGESGGLAGMAAGAVTIALLPLAEYFSRKRKAGAVATMRNLENESPDDERPCVVRQVDSCDK